jgi:hypothetical protein
MNDQDEITVPYVTAPRTLTLNQLLTGLDVRDVQTEIMRYEELDEFGDQLQSTFMVWAEAHDGTEAGEVLGIQIHVSKSLYQRLVLEYPEAWDFEEFLSGTYNDPANIPPSRNRS